MPPTPLRAVLLCEVKRACPATLLHPAASSDFDEATTVSISCCKGARKGICYVDPVCVGTTFDPISKLESYASAENSRLHVTHPYNSSKACRQLLTS